MKMPNCQHEPKTNGPIRHTKSAERPLLKPESRVGVVGEEKLSEFNCFFLLQRQGYACVMLLPMNGISAGSGDREAPSSPDLSRLSLILGDISALKLARLRVALGRSDRTSKRARRVKDGPHSGLGVSRTLYLWHETLSSPFVGTV